MYRSEAHERLSKQTAQKAHTEKGAISKELPSEQTRTVASLCLHKPWRRTPRRSLEPLYLETMTLPSQSSTRTHSISMTRLTSPSGEHQKDPTAQGAQEGQEDQTTPTEDRPGHPLFSHSSYSHPTRWRPQTGWGTPSALRQ